MPSEQPENTATPPTPAPRSAGYLQGKLLLAMPGMADPRFHRAVIFMCAHDAKGAMGLMLNHKVPNLTLGILLRQMELLPTVSKEVPKDAQPTDLIRAPVSPEREAMSVLNGGPVETGRGFILHSADFARPDTIKVTPEFSITGTIDALQAVAAGQGPRVMAFVLGYAGWGAGQLERELQENAWLVAEATIPLLFDIAIDEKWAHAVNSLGINPAMLSMDAGHA